eukprot:s1385_g52.t1
MARLKPMRDLDDCIFRDVIPRKDAMPESLQQNLLRDSYVKISTPIEYAAEGTDFTSEEISARPPDFACHDDDDNPWDDVDPNEYEGPSVGKAKASHAVPEHVKTEFGEPEEAELDQLDEEERGELWIRDADLAPDAGAMAEEHVQRESEQDACMFGAEQKPQARKTGAKAAAKVVAAAPSKATLPGHVPELKASGRQELGLAKDYQASGLDADVEAEVFAVAALKRCVSRSSRNLLPAKTNVVIRASEAIARLKLQKLAEHALQ